MFALHDHAPGGPARRAGDGMTTTRFPCPACRDHGTIPFTREIEGRKNMPWVAACLCSHGDRFAYMERASRDLYEKHAGRTQKGGGAV